MAEADIATRTQLVSPAQLVAVLAARRGAQPITLLVSTVPDMTRTGNPFLGKIRKVRRVNGMVGWDYGKALTRTGEIREIFPRKWGTRLPNSPFVTHNKSLYLEVKVEHEGEPTYFCDGEPIDVQQVAGWLPPSRPRPSIELKDYDLKNVLEVVAGGHRYILDHHTGGGN